MTIHEQFGITLRRLREKKQLSQEKFAISISMDRTYYASVEAGHRNISLNNIQKIASGFDLKISELFKEIETYTSSNTANLEEQ